MKLDELLQRHKSVIPSWIPLCYERPLELVRGDGFRAWDSEGNEYLDFCGGIVTTINGHAVPEISGAVKEQADRDLESDPGAAARFMEACRVRGVLVGKGGLKGNAIRIAPPLTVTREAAAEAGDVFEEALAEIQTREKVG